MDWRGFRAAVRARARFRPTKAVTRAGNVGRGQRSREPAVAAARCAQLPQLLLGLSLAEVHPLLAHGHRSQDLRRAARRSSWCGRATSPRLHQDARCPQKDAQEWFGKAPPDLSLVARSRGTDWMFNFLTTFYADPASRQTGVNNLQLPGTAMPHVLASLQGVQNVKSDRTSSRRTTGWQADHGRGVRSDFEPGVVGSLTPEQYDEFVRDTVNFLRLRRRPVAGRAPEPRHLGGAVPADVHRHRLDAEEGILEGRPLIGSLRRQADSPPRVHRPRRN